MIKTDDWLKEATITLRELPDKESKSKFKCENFPSGTFGGTFSVRKDDHIIERSGFVCLDLDKVDHPGLIKGYLSNNSDLIVLCFISPTGTGVKIVVRCNPHFTFKENYNGYSRYLQKILDIPAGQVDGACANISRACFLCHDAEVYLNPLFDLTNADTIPFLSDEAYFSSTSSGQSNVSNEGNPNLFESGLFEYYPVNLNFKKRESAENFIALCRLCIKEIGSFAEGKRHSWCVKLATKCNFFGMPKEKALKYFMNYFASHPAITTCKERFDEINDLEKPFDDIYEKFASEFGSWDQRCDWITPSLPNEIFEELPPFIRKLTNEFPSERERDIVFLGILTLLSTCFRWFKEFMIKEDVE